MKEYSRNHGREKPKGKYGGGFGASKPRYSRDSDSSQRRFGDRSEGRFRRDSDRFDRQPAKSHEVVCEKCGRETTVPFKPTGNKPVYCRDCFTRKDDSSSSPRYDSRDRSEPRFESRGKSDSSADDLAKINQKLDKIMKALNIE